MKAILKFRRKPLLVAVLALVLCLSAPALAGASSLMVPYFLLQNEAGEPLPYATVDLFRDNTYDDEDYNDYYYETGDGIPVPFNSKEERDASLAEYIRDLKNGTIPMPENMEFKTVDGEEKLMIKLGRFRANDRGEVTVDGWWGWTHYAFGKPLMGCEEIQGEQLYLRPTAPGAPVPTITVKTLPDELAGLKKIDEKKQPLKEVTFELWSAPVLRQQQEPAVWINKVLSAPLNPPCESPNDQGCDDEPQDPTAPPLPQGIDLTQFILDNAEAVATGSFSVYGMEVEIYTLADLLKGRVAIPLSILLVDENEGTEIRRASVWEDGKITINESTVPNWREQAPFKDNAELTAYFEWVLSEGKSLQGAVTLHGTLQADGEKVDIETFNETYSTPFDEENDVEITLPNRIIIKCPPKWK